MAQILQICSGNKKRFYNAERLRTIEKNVINSTDEVKNKNIPVSGDWKKKRSRIIWIKLLMLFLQELPIGHI